VLPDIHMFWHGPALSRLERLCMASFVANGHTVLLHAYEPPANVPDGVTIADAAKVLPRERLFSHAQSGSFAIFADGFRYRLLLEHGGLWVDTDMVCLRPFEFDSSEVFAWQDERVINNAVLGLPKGHRLAQWMSDICEQPDRALPYDSVKQRRRKLVRRWLPRNSHRHVPWGETGPIGMTAAAHHLHCTGAALPFWHFYPIHYMNWHTVFDSSLRDNPHLIAGSHGLHLWNEMARRSPGFDKNGRFPPDSLFERLCARYLKSDS
jgi:hypothetical protein